MKDIGRMGRVILSTKNITEEVLIKIFWYCVTNFREKFCFVISLFLALSIAKVESTDAIIRKKVLATLPFTENLLVNPSLEIGGSNISGWQGWKEGYVIDESISHSGKRCAKIEKSNGDNKEYGIYQKVVLNQTEPAPIVIESWSKAEDVSGSVDNNYSLYVDIEYMDGTHLWGKSSNFSCGTHDWEKKGILLIPEKPVKLLTVYGLFRGLHTGTVWFDDFSLSIIKASQYFDGFPVQSISWESSETKQIISLKTSDGFTLLFDKSTGELIGEKNRRGGFYLRDVANNSDFHQPVGKIESKDGNFYWEAVDKDLNLKLYATYSVKQIESGMSKGRGYIRVDGVVEDLSKHDRAVSVYFSLPIDAEGWIWSNDVRSEEMIKSNKSYIKAISFDIGANGMMSWYPLACISSNAEGLTIAVPLDTPRLYRIAYNSYDKEFYIVFDFALVPDTDKFPSKADFHFIIYRMDPNWRFRAALQTYYDIFPEFFIKQVKKEGIWMPFTDIATIPNFEDFYFAFQEGAQNPSFDDEHDIYSFIYIEPFSHWLSMPSGVPRTYDGIMSTLKEDLKGKRGLHTKNMAIATFTSGAYGPDGKLDFSIRKTPWCDGALLFLNPDPEIPTTPELPLTKYMIMLNHIESAMSHGSINVSSNKVDGWDGYGGGYTLDEKIKKSGDSSIFCEANFPGEYGAFQRLMLNQKDPKPLLVKGWSKAEDVTGSEDKNYAIYVDLYYNDGTNEYGLASPFSVGTHDWEEKSFIINPKKPISTLAIYLLFRRTHTGKVWFDEISLTQIDSDTNLLKNPDFERNKKGEIDGVYIDSFEGYFDRKNYRRDHFRCADIPLVFHQETYRPCILSVFQTYEFACEISKKMKERGKLLFANTILWHYAFPIHLFDIAGIEVNWLKEDRYSPDNDDVMNYRRALSYRKPYCLLMNTNYEKFNHQFVEKYFKRCLFYSIFPSFFDEEASTKNNYWGSKRWYERDQDLFKKYLPIIITIAQAGWEPITYANSDKDKIYVERYGSAKEGNLYFTILNDANRKESFRLTLDAESLGLKGEIKATELLSGKKIALLNESGKITLTGEIDSEDVWVLKIEHNK